MEALSDADVPFAEALCDVTSIDASSKRVRKSVDRTLKHLDRCVEIKNSNKVSNFCSFLVILGGDNCRICTYWAAFQDFFPSVCTCIISLTYYSIIS